MKMDNDHLKYSQDPLVELAWSAIKEFIEKDTVVAPIDLKGNPNQAGCFVSIHTKPFDDLRGCIGTIAPTRETLAEEIIHNAIAAATEDPRFPPIRKEELENLSINVDVLLPPTVAQVDELDPQRYGVIVTHGMRRGVLLPALDGVDTVGMQLVIACQKAGINPSSHFDIEKFEVVRHT